MTTIYTYQVKILRSGQPRPYAAHESEYLISITTIDQRGPDQGKTIPWLPRYTPAERQRQWAVDLAKALCRKFREVGENDGRTGMDAHFYPTLRALDIDPEAGTIRVLITEAFTD